ncbi:macrolide 2'-phosphotransferase [Galactobacter caseinivorans]|uniref:Aminoglycoside phosphotransferase n=1 Tax=Galactobacter caseinivorans TaxID=2676123 RepID=A0A496PN96_9MICC|nr:macrolide 2'-phosphotransferase [Galactobacter caseinivorans]RKW71969.1 aminoglycoside phosphotransferase [Galactobacter caseinivorans]
MKRSPLDLAAVATAAVPGLVASQVGRLPDDAEDFDAALVVDSKGSRWRVRSPKHPDASLRLETELRALGGLSPTVRATLPFSVPTVAGTVKQGELKTFVYHHLDGHVLSLDELLASPDLATQVGRTIAAIHEIDRETVERAGLATYDAEEFRRARLSELDQVASSGKVPARLLRRWENAMEDVSLWRFNPSAVHGDLHEEQLFVHEDRLVAVTGWSDLHVGDPAEDLAWLLALDDQRTIDAVVNAYSARRGDKADPHLMRRATLAAEFALARWLARALTRGDAARVAEAEVLLADLDTNLQELGDRPVGLVEAGPERPEHAPSVTQLDDAAPTDPADADAAGGPVVDAKGDWVEPTAAENSTPEQPAVLTPAVTELPAPAVTAKPAAQAVAEPDPTPEVKPEQDAEPKQEAKPEQGDEPTPEATQEPAKKAASEDKETDEPADGPAAESADEDDDAVITDADVPDPATEAMTIVPPAEKPKPTAEEDPAAKKGREQD